MATEDALLDRIRAGIVRAIQPKLPKETQKPREDSLAGFAVGAGYLDDLTSAFTKPGTDLEAVYEDMREMDDSVTEVATAVDTLSEDAMTPDATQPLPFRFVFEQEAPRLTEVVNELFDRLNITGLLVDIAREALLMGNEFRQIGVNKEMQVVDLMYLAPETMRVQTDKHGRFDPEPDPEEPLTWPYAQYINESFKAGYFAWEVAHARWKTRGGSLYGSPLFYTARWPWRKLIAMEDALVLNWLTRAFARLLFKLDVTGKSDKEARAFIKQFQAELQTARIGARRTSQSSLAVIRDIFIGLGHHQLAGRVQPGLANVEVLDTSGSVFVDVAPLEYYRGKILMAGRVPRAYLGLEADINAKATLVAEDRKYAKTLQTVQQMVGQVLLKIYYLECLLQGIDANANRAAVLWNNPSRADAVDHSLALSQFANADQTYLEMGVLDQEYIALKHVGMTPIEWERISSNVQRQAAIVAAQGGDE